MVIDKVPYDADINYTDQKKCIDYKSENDFKKMRFKKSKLNIYYQAS